MIPKKIHFCWFGGNPLSDKAIMCIESWKKFMPDYEICRWDENNFDPNAYGDYVAQAYAAKKYAFVADYFRFWVLHEHGGIYFDSDVEVVKSFDDLLEHDIFTGYEDRGTFEPAVLGAVAGHRVFAEMLEYFKSTRFINEDGSMNIVPLPIPFTAKMREMYSIKELNFKKTIVLPDGAIYPKAYFSPQDMFTFKVKVTPNTYCIHRFTNSWRSPEELKKLAKVRKLSKFMGRRLAHSLVFNGFGGTVKKIFKYPFRKRG
ncbi:MAG: glycosyl transferase [Clostridiales bacterium]|nr:glycosyl transferase [Clostridiales bacterium]